MVLTLVLAGSGAAFASAGFLPAGETPAEPRRPVPLSSRTESGAYASDTECADACTNALVHFAGGDAGAPFLASAAGFSVITTGFSFGEPTIGLTDDATKIYIQVGTQTIRNTNSGVGPWTEIAPLQENLLTFDPMMYYDPVINRLYVDQLTVACSIMSWTDSPQTANGALTDTSWKTNPMTCGLPANDHQKLEGGPSPLLGAANSGRALYYSASQIPGGIMVARSLDGGLTWIPAFADLNLGRGFVLAWPGGPVTADPAGQYVYVADHSPVGLHVAFSDNEGLTWSSRLASLTSGAQDHFVDPEVAVDSAGTAYVVWWNKSTKQVVYQFSTNHGNSWSTTPVQVSGSPILSTVYPTAVARSPGKLDVAFYGTKDSAVGPDACTPAVCRWYLFFAQIENATTGTPTITVTQVTPDSDPIQIGKICTQGTDCNSGRNLLDFIDIEVDGSGFAHVAYTDGCINACGPAQVTQSGANANRYARQTTGNPI